MTAAAEQIYIHGIYIKRNLSIRLNCIRVKQNSMFMCYGSNSADWLYGSYLIVGCHNRYQYCVWSYGCFQLIRIHQPLFVHVKVCHIKTQLLQIPACVKNGMVFYPGCDYMLSLILEGFNNGLKSPVVRLRASPGEVDLLRLRPKGIGNYIPCHIYYVLIFGRKCIHA